MQLIVQPSADAYISKVDGLGYNTDDLIVSTDLVTNDPLDYNHCLLRFDFSALPIIATITAANLWLYAYDDHFLPANGRMCWALGLTQTGWIETEATWANYRSGTAWTTPGGDWMVEHGAYTALYQGNNNWNVLNLIKYFWANTNKIANILIKFDAEPGTIHGGQIFHSSSYADPDYRPTLTITYIITSNNIMIF